MLKKNIKMLNEKLITLITQPIILHFSLVLFYTFHQIYFTFFTYFILYFSYIKIYYLVKKHKNLYKNQIMPNLSFNSSFSHASKKFCFSSLSILSKYSSSLSEYAFSIPFQYLRSRLIS